MKFFSTLIFVFLLLVPSLSAAQIDEPITEVNLSLPYDAIAAGESNWLLLTMKPKEGWHTYWINPGDSGIPTEIAWTLQEGFEVGPIHWPQPERLSYEFLMNYGYDGTSVLPIPLTVDTSVPEGNYTLLAKADWLVCEEICIPESAELVVHVVVENETTREKPTLTNAIESLPELRNDIATSVTANAERVEYRITWDRPISQADFFPLDNGLIDNAADITTTIDGQTALFTTRRGSQPLTEMHHFTLAVTDAEGEHYVQISASVSEGTIAAAKTTLLVDAETSSITLINALILAFFGGIILNAMPCVLPVLALKALSLSKHSVDEAGKVRAHGLAYTLGICLSFVTISIILFGLQQAGSVVGWGFQLQSPVFVTGLALVLFVVGLNLSGVFEISNRLGNIGNVVASENSLRGSFFTGVLAVLVATPCTAPFMAPAVGFALTQSLATSIIVFVALGLGLAFPYILISFVPETRHMLPKPGAWMHRFKQSLAFPMYATVAWLAWVVVIQTGPTGIIWLSMGMLSLALALWVTTTGASRIAKIIIFVTAVAISFFATTQQETVSASQNADVSYEDFSPERLAELRVTGTPVFVDATAAWCITCKVNERVALKRDAVQQVFAEQGIVLMVADWTDKNDTITRYLAEYGRSGVPLYVYYAPDAEPVILPQILTPSIVLETVQSSPTS